MNLCDRPELDVSPTMILAGLEAWEDCQHVSNEDRVSMIYMLMEYQRRRESASATISRK